MRMLVAGFWGVLALAASGVTQAAVLPDAAAPSLIIGSNGLGMFAYYDPVNGDLKVGRCVDAACSAVTTSVLDSAGDVGRYPYMTPGTSGTLGPVISYEDTTNHRLKLAMCVDPACAAATTVVIAPDIGVAHGSAVTIGSDGRALVAYLRYLDTIESEGKMVTAHCDNDPCTAVTTTVHSQARPDRGIDMGRDGDARGFVAFMQFNPTFGSVFVSGRCLDTACTGVGPLQPRSTSFGRGQPPPPGGVSFQEAGFASLSMGPDNLPNVAYVSQNLFGPPEPMASLFLRNVASRVLRDVAFEPLDIAVGSDNRAHAVVRRGADGGLDYVQCLDAECGAFERTCLSGIGRLPSLTIDGAGQPLAAFEIAGAVSVGAPSGSCGSALTISGGSRVEGAGGPLPFTVRLGPAQTTPVTVQFATADGTATAGADYAAATGTITFPPGSTEQTVAVQVLSDLLDEPDETFTVTLSGAAGAAIVVGSAAGTIVDDDTAPVVDVFDCAVVETNGPGASCQVPVRLTAPYPEPVTVQYATADGTATAGIDYAAATGVLTFAPGTVSGSVSVSVVGDLTPEPDEWFTLALSSPVNATLGDATAEVTILDDDGLPAGDSELIHGATVTADLAAGPGPSADVDDYRLAQAPFASYEVILDAVSGDVAPDVRLDRLASDGSTVLQPSTAVGTGSARRLRFQNRLALQVIGQSIRVGSASCTTACGADDVYRLRAYETTASIPRFNNSATQVTVVVVQNTSDASVSANLDFWSADGALLATSPLSLQPHGLAVANSAAIAALAGQSGSITITHDGGYGALAGKAVALEPATGFSFDSPLAYKPR